MADYIARSVQALQSNGGVAIPGTNPRQELVTEENVQRWVAEGKVFGINVGSINTPASFIGAVLANAVPELALQPATGQLVIPLELRVNVITCAAGVLNVAMITSTTTVGTGGGSTAGTSINLNQPAFAGAGATSRITFTSAGTALTSPLEVWRFGVATAQNSVLLGAPQPPTWSYKTNIPPRVIGPGNILVCTGEAGAATGYIEMIYALFAVGDE